MIFKAIGAGLLTLAAYSEAMQAANRHTARLITASTAAGGLDASAKYKTLSFDLRSKAIFVGAAVLGAGVTAMIIGGE